MKFRGAQGSRQGASFPRAQIARAQEDSAAKVAVARRRNPNSSTVRQIQRNMHETSTIAGGREMTRIALQGVGDDEPLSHSLYYRSDVGNLERNKDGNVSLPDDEISPLPYTPLLRRRLADGQLWPSVGPLFEGKEYSRLRNESTMSPSAAQFSAEVEYQLRRNFKSCPAHIAEKIDFTELMIDRVYASRRSKEMYIVWSTVHPSARYEIEPFLAGLGYWIRRMIFQRIRWIPNAPHIHWVYNSGMMREEVPKKVMMELKNAELAASEDIEDRVEFLKRADTLTHRMKGIPWFMPYLWAKDQRQEKKKVMESDLAKVNKAKGNKVAPPSGGDIAAYPGAKWEPTYVS